MEKKIPKYFFDKRDYELLGIVRDVLGRDTSMMHARTLLGPHLHPHGIKEMAASSGLRIAYAAIHLLGSLQTGEAKERLEALRTLHAEALSRAHSILRKNTARVLLQIMKELIRAEGDEVRKLQLARDFRSAATGKPRVIKDELAKYHLAEMPEAWNQVAFDHHVHDVNTKGRKSATHLIMDAWIKGIRTITVVYYNYVRPEIVTELLEAASLVNIKVRIGVEFSVLFRNKYAKIVWAPRGFTDQNDFINFFSKMPVREFFKEQQLVSSYQQEYVFRVLDAFNASHRTLINASLGVAMPPLSRDAFLTFVGIGQVSIFHLAKFIYTVLMPLLQQRVEVLKGIYPTLADDEKERIALLVEKMNCLDSETIIANWLAPDKNPAVPDPLVPRDDPEVPTMLKLSAQELLTILSHMHSGYRATLNLTKLYVEDALELLYDCKGMITHLEIFNLKDYTEGKTSPDLGVINDLQLALNHGNVIEIKRVVRTIIEHFDESIAGRSGAQAAARKIKLVEILFDIEKLQSFYGDSTLKSRLGSDSTGRSRHLHGMGLIINDTLPESEQKRFRNVSIHAREGIPVTATIYKRRTFVPRTSFSPLANSCYGLVRRLPGGAHFGYSVIEDWVVQDFSLHLGRPGNITTLGGIQTECNNGLALSPPEEKENTLSWKYLNSGVKNCIKLLVGFIPAFLTFALTKDWWLLAYFGAFIWFGITGFRNVLQSVLGGGGFRRSPLLRWNSYVSWERITDSLFFTGFSVPLLDYLVKSLVLDRMFNITTTTSPLLLYSVMALANGVYISSHNIFRGLPKSAAYGNFFRSVLSIPLAVAFNALIGGLLSIYGLEAINDILQRWAAVISKAASDCVAGVIEGLADRGNNMRMRFLDYRDKLRQLFETFSCLEVLCPEVDLLEMLKTPKDFMCLLSTQGKDLELLLSVHALDFMHFWMYQPRSRSMLKYLMQTMSAEERLIFVRCQGILLRQREISQLFIDGIVGKNFSRPLAFYLDRSGEYLEALHTLDQRMNAIKPSPHIRPGSFFRALQRQH